MAVRPRGLTPGGPVAAGITVALLLGGVLGGLFAQNYIRGRDRETDRLRIAADARRLEAELDALVARTEWLAALVPDRAAFVREARSTAFADTAPEVVALLPARGGRPLAALGSTRASPFDREGAGEPVRQAIDGAVSSGRARVAAPVAAGDAETVVVVAPVPVAGTLDDVTSRRAATDTVVATSVRTRELLRPAGAVPLWPGAEVQVVTPDGAFGERPDDVVDSVDVAVAGGAWTVEVGPLAGHQRLLGWWVFAIAVVAAGIVHVALRRLADQRRSAEEDASRRARQLGAIAETSTTLQRSLDLADLLPAFCVTVAERLEVTAVSVQVVGETGELVEVFRFGTRGPDDVEATAELRRGWSRVGRLALAGPRPLDEADTRSLEALADLLAVAITNAQLYQREQQAVARLSELDALKNAFLGTVSHELRTSTTAVQGFGDLLDGHWETLAEERRRELARRIKRQAGSLRHLVDDLLDYARLEHHGLRVDPRHESLTDLVRQVVESMAPLVADHEVVLVAPSDVRAWVDPIAVERITANLLSNAGKYSPPGTRITVRVERDGDRARLEVWDQGPGIPVEERRRVFVRFYRRDDPTTMRTRGAGIGLSILHDFAERSNAEVGIDDAPGGGARFTVSFPTAPVTVTTAGGAA